MTQARGLIAYTVPKIDVLVSANWRSVPNAALGAGSTSASNGTSRAANAPVPNLVVQQSLGRLPANGLPNGTTTVNLLNPAVLYGDRISQVDMRFAKVLRFGRTRFDVGVDLYNLLNSNYALTYDSNYSFTQPNGGTWLNPTTILGPRFARINATFNF